MTTSPLRWGLRALGTLLGGAALWFLPVFDWMAAVKVVHVQPEAAATAAAAPERRLVILVSVDGLAPRVLAQAPSPTLDRLAREGHTSADARTVVPSITLTSHASMLSGVGPDVHGVGFNRYQPWSQIAIPTLYTTCRRESRRRLRHSQLEIDAA